MNKFIPEAEYLLHGGTQRIYWFPNGYGASVVRHKYSYGGPAGLWELAVLDGKPDYNKWKLCYDTSITDDVIGYLTDEKIEELLAKVAALSPREHD